MTRIVFAGRLIALVTLLGAGAAAAADGAGLWLARMSEATRTANYEGVVVYRGEDVLETFRVTHRFANGSERERVQSMTGEVREVLKQNDKLTCLLPKDRQLTSSRPSTPKGLFQALTPERLNQIAAVYELRSIGTARVAGRLCRGVAIAPRDEFRYGYELWADDETGLPLKLSLVAPDGRLLEQMFFTEVRYPQQIADSAFESQASDDQVRQSTVAAADAIAAAHEREPMEEEQVGSAAVEADGPPGVGELPPGFRLVRRQISASPAGVREHLVLSDGLSAISVYRIQRRDGQTAKIAERLDQMGPLNAYSRMIGSTQVMVLGEVPRRTIRMIGDSLQPSELSVPPASTPIRDSGVGAN